MDLSLRRASPPLLHAFQQFFKILLIGVGATACCLWYLPFCREQRRKKKTCIEESASSRSNDADQLAEWALSSPQFSDRPNDVAQHDDRPLADPQVSFGSKVTVILSTSPTGRHPETDVIDEVLASFRFAKSIGNCRMIIVCDGYRRFNGDGVEFTENQCRSGIVDAETAQNYEAYKKKLHERFSGRVDGCGTPLANIEILELSERQGFGFAVKAALAKVRTPYVLVAQHDRAFVREVDLPRLILAMEAAPEKLKYLGLPTSTTISHAHHVLSKYRIWIEPIALDDGGLQGVPLIQWYDSMHLAETTYYRDFVFGPRKLVAKGGFIEDKFGQAQLADIRKRGVDVAHPEYGTFIVAGPGFEEPVVRHLDGRDRRGVKRLAR